jgi:hypothetical protein
MWESWRKVCLLIDEKLTATYPSVDIEMPEGVVGVSDKLSFNLQWRSAWMPADSKGFGYLSLFVSYQKKSISLIVQPGGLMEIEGILLGREIRKPLLCRTCYIPLGMERGIRLETRDLGCGPTLINIKADPVLLFRMYRSDDLDEEGWNEIHKDGNRILNDIKAEFAGEINKAVLELVG